jgi:hypothetical protein
VLRDKIADNGLSILLFKSINIFAQALPFPSFTMRNDTGVESNTDSIIEQRKETISARNK